VLTRAGRQASRTRAPARATAERPAGLPALDLTQRLLYRDGLALVIDKPAGLPVHAGPGGGPNLEALFDQLRFGLPQPPALAHRLDRDTSGCLILGRHRKALSKLGRLFSGGQVEKVYWAVVAGAPAAPEGSIELALRKETRRNGWRMVPDPEGGREARTEYRLLGRGDGRSWLELRPRTGRTHQIRVHCAALGCPLLGDPVYGSGGPAPLQLHARSVSFPLYPSRAPVGATAPVPPHMVEALRACGWAGEPAPQAGAVGP
jgi:tRNA pseudouridine32 synthase/23S rRNA pseudouridine746 synthase/23S rRNA pseudouridine1911/1915/1917 synthase